MNSLAQRFRESREETARALVTGYVLADYLDECEMASVSTVHRVDVSTVEEGHANLISALLTGIQFDELQRWAYQDPVKIDAANRMKRVLSNPNLQKLLDIHSRSEMVKFWQGLRAC